VRFDAISERFGSRAAHITLRRIGLMASWGDIELQPLTQNDMTVLAQDKSPNLGFLVDYLMNFHGIRESGPPPFIALAAQRAIVWIARFEEDRKKGRPSLLGRRPFPK